jgi:hypothetical protein
MAEKFVCSACSLPMPSVRIGGRYSMPSVDGF